LKAVPTQDMTNPTSLISLYFKYAIPFLSTVCNTSSFSHTAGPPYIHHPYTPLHFENLHVILIYFTKCLIFSIIQSNAVNVGLTHILSIHQ